MSILFIGDVHLNQQNPTTIFTFINFLRTRALTADAIYILGDLFEIWIGDDDPNPLHHNIAMEIHTLYKRGIPCYFIHGNRDFLLSSKYAAICGMQLLSDYHVIQYAGQRVIIMHGDTLCTQNISYKYFRRLVHYRWLQRLFLLLPIQQRLLIAKKIRTNSIIFNKCNINNIIEINKQLVVKVMNYTGATIMVHGHIHNPAIYTLENGNYRAVLGSWDRGGSIIEVQNSIPMLFQFSI